ncbi:MAG: serine/threonine-protein kinase, partial [Gaiellaceae bacterium]
MIAIQALPQRYTSATLIARGGMGEVYRATDSVLERKVAVKLLSERYATDPEVRARFQREALAAARLSGTPHVITIFDVGEHEERPYLVMEYLVGGSVHDRLREGPVPTDQALDWLAQAGQALDRAHQEGVVHRDVKPANLLLDREGKISVTDFGIASTSGMDTLTLPGTVLGTAGYLSPEQARGEPATAASDRYGLGVVAFELVTGQRPFVGETAATEAFAHVNAPIPSAEHLRPGLPDGVDEVLARALAKNPQDRPATCSELVSDLRGAFRGAVAAPTVFAGAPTQVLRTQPASTRRSTHRSGRRPPLRLLLGAAGLLLAGLAAAVLLGVIWDDDPQRNARRPSGQTTQTTQPTPTTGTTEAQTTQTTEATETTPTVGEAQGVALNEEGFAFMQSGDFGGALPFLERAVDALSGSGSLSEAYASYNLAYTRFALGGCDGVLPLLDRS